MEHPWLDFWIQVASTIVGGIFLTFLFFLAKEKIFSLPALNGLWTLELTTLSSSYNPYIQMKLTFLLLLTQEDNSIFGTGEKIREVTQESEKHYEGKNRIQIEIKGYITKRYFSRDEIVIRVEEAGEVRKSSSVYSLKVISKNKLSGTFVSTIANSSGNVLCTRGNSHYNFSRKT